MYDRYNWNMTTQTVATKLQLVSPVDAMLEATAKVISVVPVKSPKPVLSNIRFTIQDGVLEIAGTDLVAGIYYSIPAATIANEGSGLLNGIRLSELLKEFRGSEAKVAFNPRGGCTFKAKGGRYKIVGDDPRDYPIVPRFEGKPGFTILGTDVIDMVKKTIFAVAPQESRLTTNGVLFELKGTQFRLAATDHRRISITERQVEASVEDFSVSVPPEFLKAMLKVSSKDVASGKATIGVHGKKIFYKVGTATVYATVLNGKFPPYEEGL
jgi:DNA polymerase-3 subunit beta